jgi:hypothetical protein
VVDAIDAGTILLVRLKFRRDRRAVCIGHARRDECVFHRLQVAARAEAALDLFEYFRLELRFLARARVCRYLSQAHAETPVGRLHVAFGSANRTRGRAAGAAGAALAFLSLL